MHGCPSQDLFALMSQIRYLRVNIVPLSERRQAVSRRAKPRRAPLVISAGALHTPGAAGGTNAPARSLDSSVIAGLDPAIQRLLDARLKAGHDIVDPLSAPAHSLSAGN
jgi:hypothetical protein